MYVKRLGMRKLVIWQHVAGATRRDMTHSTISCSPSFHILRPKRASTRANAVTSSVSNTCSKPSKCPFTATALDKRDTLGIRATVTTISSEKAIESLRCESIDFLVKFVFMHSKRLQKAGHVQLKFSIVLYFRLHYKYNLINAFVFYISFSFSLSLSLSPFLPLSLFLSLMYV